VSARPKIGLWRLNQRSGRWEHQRDCAQALAADWLALYRRDEPGAEFRLSEKEPEAKTEKSPSPKAGSLALTARGRRIRSLRVR
jgi:hypothetical protein